MIEEITEFLIKWIKFLLSMIVFLILIGLLGYFIVVSGLILWEQLF